MCSARASQSLKGILWGALGCLLGAASRNCSTCWGAFVCQRAPSHSTKCFWLILTSCHPFLHSLPKLQTKEIFWSCIFSWRCALYSFTCSVKSALVALKDNILYMVLVSLYCIYTGIFDNEGLAPVAYRNVKSATLASLQLCNQR